MGVDPGCGHKAVLARHDGNGNTPLRVLQPEPANLGHDREPQPFITSPAAVQVCVLHRQSRGVESLHSVDLLQSLHSSLLCLDRFIRTHWLVASFSFFFKGTNVFRNWSHAGSSVCTTLPISWL